MMTTHEIILLAAKHAGKNESALLCLADAKACMKIPHLVKYARRRALHSLLHSVGMFHPDYQAAAAMNIMMGYSTSHNQLQGAA